MPKYRLSVLMTLRERAKEAAERHLAVCMAELKREQDRLRQMEDELERMIQKRETKKREYAEKAMRGELDARSAVSSNAYLDRLKEQESMQEDVIDAQHGVIDQKKDVVEDARNELIHATQELKALEKHKEKWEKEVKLERQKKQEDLQDEIAQTIFMRRE